MTKFFLVRHGQTDWNREGKYTGQFDISLNDTGREQARQAAERLKRFRPDIVIASDLKRAVETARIIADEVGVPVRTDSRLREIHQGQWEGLHENEIKRRFNELFHARQADPFNISSPGGETIGEVHQRVLAALRGYCAEFEDQKVVLSAHGVVLAIVRITAQRLPIQKIFEYIPENAVVHTVEIEKGEI